MFCLIKTAILSNTANKQQHLMLKQVYNHTVGNDMF